MESRLDEEITLRSDNPKNTAAHSAIEMEKRSEKILINVKNRIYITYRSIHIYLSLEFESSDLS